MKTSSKAISAATAVLRPTRAAVLLLFLAACPSSEPAPSGLDSGLDSGLSSDAVASADAQALEPADTGAPDLGVLQDSCDPVKQTGCSDPTRPKCIIEQSNPDSGIGAHCVADDPSSDKNLDAVCGGGNCKAGLACVRTATAPECKEICDPRMTTNGCASLGADYACDQGVLDSNYAVCVALAPSCDGNTQAPCASDQSCQIYPHLNGSFDLRCEPVGAGTQGAACARGSDCARGFLCLYEGATPSACYKICRANGDCPTSAPMCNGTVAAVGLRYCSN
jgi:hypothetical protein